MRPLSLLRMRQATAIRQRGIVLFFALIAMLAMSLAAVALIRSVDTGTMIAGNLALKQGATTASDAGFETAITFLQDTYVNNAATNPVTNSAHPYNQDSPALGYYASMDPALDLTDGALWSPGRSVAVIPDGSGYALPDRSGNKVRYIVQRMCRTSGVVIPDAKCLFGLNPPEGEKSNIPTPQNWCDRTKPGCPTPGQTPLLRITTRTEGPKNTVSYVQGFVY